MRRRTEQIFLTALFPLLVSTDAKYELTKVKLDWVSAQNSCTVLGKSEFCEDGKCDIQRNKVGDTNDAWIGSYYVKSDWISYLGCHRSDDPDSTSKTIEIKDNSVEKCYSTCKDKMDPQRQLFALQELYCFCNFRSENPTSKEMTCKKKCKTTDDHCGSNVQILNGKIFGPPFASLYKVNVENLQESETNADCKAIINGNVTADSCFARHGVICKKGDSESSQTSTLYKIFQTKANWFEARNLCRLNASSGRLIIKEDFDVILNTVNISAAYWIGEFRLDQMHWLQEQKPSKVPSFCGGIFVNGTVARFTKDSCKKTKYTLCIAKATEKTKLTTPVISTASPQKLDSTTIKASSVLSESSTLDMKEKTTTSSQQLSSIQTITNISNVAKEVVDFGNTESSTMMNLNTSTSGQSLIPSQSKTDSSSDSKEIFIFIGLGLAFLVLLCIVAIVLILRKKKTKQKLKMETNDTYDGDLPMVEGQALLLSQSGFNEINPSNKNTNEKDMGENKLDSTSVDGNENGEYSHLHFQGSRRDSTDMKDDTYDHATGMLDDDLYSKTKNPDNSKERPTDNTYDHIFDLLDDIYSTSNLPLRFDDDVLDTQYDHTTDVTKDTHTDDKQFDNEESEKNQDM